MNNKHRSHSETIRATFQIRDEVVFRPVIKYITPVRMFISFLSIWSLFSIFPPITYTQVKNTIDSLCGTIFHETVINPHTILERPLGLDSLLVTAHFAIHYSITPGDSNQTTQAYAESTAIVAEYARNIEYEALGWRQPLSDGDTLYDIYIRKVVEGSLGRTIPEANGLSNAPCQSYIELRMGQTMSNLRHTLAHELLHASQYAYAHEARASDRGAWFYENTAEWATQYVVGFTDVQFLNRINGFSALVAPYQRITYANGAYEYGGALWCNFLMEWTGDSLVVRKIWERMNVSGGQQILKDIDTVLLMNYGKKLDEALSQYAIWRSFTGKRTDSYHFKYAQKYTALKDTICASYPFILNRTDLITKPAGPGGCKYYVFKKSGSSLTLSFHGQEGHLWKVYVIALKTPQASIIDTLSLNSSSYGAKTFSWTQADSFTVIPVAMDTAYNSPSLTFALSAFDTNAVPIQFTNTINTLNAGGMFLMDNSDSVPSGESRFLALGSQHTIRPVQERFILGGDSIFKHHDWNGMTTSFLHSFRVDSAFSFIANFIPITPETIKSTFNNFPSVNGGTIQFRDLWYIHTNGTQPDSFFTYLTPFVPTGAYDRQTGGVFLNQTIESGNYYSVRAESIHILDGYAYTFNHWEATHIILQPGNANPGYNEQSVVFTNDNATLNAVYTRGQQAQYIHLDSLWNLISIPSESSDYSIGHLFPGALSPAYYYDAVTHTYLEEDALQHGIGYWVKNQQDTLLPTLGNPLMNDTIEVSAGWNIIGSLSIPLGIHRIETEPTGIFNYLAYGYNRNGYISVDSLQPGKGYWIKVDQSGKIILNGNLQNKK